MARTVIESGSRPIDLERLGRYRIVRPLSKGGMALVFEARRESLAGVSPRVAIKLILPEHKDSDTFQELFINEARLGASMHHQNLVQIQDFDRDGDHFFLVMEYVEGLTLRQIVSLCVRHELEIPVGVIAEIGRQACDGLHYAHQATDDRGVHLALVHRDVKPSNLMLNPHGVVKILDFGISKGNLLAERSGAVRGTWGYMAPEQATGREVGPNADVFGLATILYEMASRKALFRKKTPDEIKRLLVDDHAARMAATLPSEYGPLVGVLVRALQRDPAARYASGADFGRSLSALLPDPITARDEVVAFFRKAEALEQGRAVPPPKPGKNAGGLALPGPASSQASLAAEGSKHDGGGTPWGWIVAGTIVALLLGAVGIGLGLWLASGAPIAGPVVLDLDDLQGATTVDVPEDDAPAVSAAPGEAAGDDPAVTDAADAGTAADPVEEPASRRLPTESVPPPEGFVPDPVVPIAAPEPDAPVVVRIDRRTPEVSVVEVAPDGGTEVTPAEPEPPEPVATGSGWITLAAQPYGLDYDVFIDGKLVPKAGPRAPLVRHELPAGEHFVTISAAGGARKQFEVSVAGDQHVRKVWDFDRNQWRR